MGRPRYESKPKVYITMHAAADMLDCSPDTIRKFIAEGKLPAYKLHHEIRIKATDVEALLVPIPTAGPGEPR